MLRLREIRKSNNMTMKELGNLLHLTESAISLYETGKNKPDYETLLKISKIFNVSVDYLIGNTNAESQKPNTIKVIGKSGNLEEIEFTEEEIQAFKTLFKEKFNKK